MAIYTHQNPTLGPDSLFLFFTTPSAEVARSIYQDTTGTLPQHLCSSFWAQGGWTIVTCALNLSNPVTKIDANRVIILCQRVIDFLYDSYFILV